MLELHAGLQRLLSQPTSKENITEKLCGAFTHVNISDFTVKPSFGTQREAPLNHLFASWI